MHSSRTQQEQLTGKLHAWTRAAAATIARSPNTADTVSGVLKPVKRILQGVAHTCNARHPMLSLPEALLRRLLDFVEPEDVWAISQTCRHLRVFSISTPSLWRTMTWIRGSQNVFHASTGAVNRAALLAQRSYPDVLEFCGYMVMFDFGDEQAVISLLQPIIHRLRRVALATSLNTMVLFRILEMPAPAMEEFAIATSASDPSAILPCNLFGGEVAGKLHTLELHNITVLLSRPHPALSNLRVFKWTHYALDVDSVSLGLILGLMPRLVSLHLRVNSFTWRAGGAVIPNDCCLRDLTLSTKVPPNLPDILACLGHVNLTRFSCGQLCAEILAALTEQPTSASFGEVLREVVVRPSTSSELLAIRDNNDIVGELFSTHIPGTLLGSLTELSLHEHYWPSAHVGPPHMPLLRYLRISLASCRFYRERPWESPVGILTGWGLAAWDMPALDALDIIYRPPRWTCRWGLSPDVEQKACSCAESLYISLADVQHFVASCLPRPHGRRFAKISLLGIEPVDREPWAALAPLESMAEEVVLSPIAVLTKFEIDDGGMQLW